MATPHLHTPWAHRPTSRAALLVALLFAAGCGDEKVVAVGGGPLDTTDSSIADTSPDGVDTTDPTPSGRELIVLHDASQPL
ncbi:MAG TPA: hypothetical protein PK095_21400, partial [Myxococcota bacterium]|nr:hypothetical protein [Myxococcota bacterium]